MANFKSTCVDSRQIDSTSISIDDEIKELLSVSEVIKADIMAQLEPHWQGDAKQKFDSQFKLFGAQLSKLVEEYQALNKQLKEAGATYDKADNSVMQLIAKLPK